MISLPSRLSKTALKVFQIHGKSCRTHFQTIHINGVPLPPTCYTSTSYFTETLTYFSITLACACRCPLVYSYPVCVLELSLVGLLVLVWSSLHCKSYIIFSFSFCVIFIWYLTLSELWTVIWQYTLSGWFHFTIGMLLSS